MRKEVRNLFGINRGAVEKKESRRPVTLVLVLWVTIMFGAFQTAHAQQKPDWLRNHPATPLYYIGIDGVSKTSGDTDYKSIARETALNKLISQIEVNISGKTTSVVQEVNGEYQELYINLVEAQAEKVIEDYEIVDEWETDTEYWIYLRLSKKQYRERLQQKIELAQKQAVTALTEAKKSQETGAFVTALSLLVKGFGDIAPYADRLEDVDFEGQAINLYSELRNRLQITLDQIRLIAMAAPEEVRIGKTADGFFPVKAETAEGKPLLMLPVKFSFLRGDGELVNPVYSGLDGIANGQLSKLTGKDKLQIIKAGVELSEFLAEEQKSSFTDGILNSLNAPEVRFIIRASGVPAYLDYQELFLEEAKISNYLQPVFKNYFTEAGYTFIDDLSEAELFIELDASTRKGSENYGIYSTFLDYKVSVTNLLTGEEVATFSQTDIKGMSDSYEKAAAKAFETGIDSLQNKIIPQLISQIQQ